MREIGLAVQGQAEVLCDLASDGDPETRRSLFGDDTTPDPAVKQNAERIARAQQGIAELEAMFPDAGEEEQH